MRKKFQSMATNEFILLKIKSYATLKALYLSIIEKILFTCYVASFEVFLFLRQDSILLKF